MQALVNNNELQISQGNYLCMYNYLLCLWIYYTNVKYMIIRFTDVCAPMLSALIIIGNILMDECRISQLVKKTHL